MSTEFANSMWSAFYGRLALHPWRDLDTAESDAYSLFVAKSCAMGWLTAATERACGGVWGMNDAELDRDSGAQPPRVAWFQVVLTEPIGLDRLLPVQPFLACAGDVMARVGVLQLDALQILLPMQSLAPAADASSRGGAAGTLLQAAGWFADPDPSATTQVLVTLDSGQNPSIISAAPGVVAWMREFKQDVFVCDSFSLADDQVVDLAPTISDAMWLGPARHRATFSGTIPEWSLDALGWLAALLAHACHRSGITTPLLLTAAIRSGSTCSTACSP